jgi:hypothetical protein
MQSDQPLAPVLSALGPQIASFRFVLSHTLERARTILASASGSSQAQVTLGDFAAGRIDAARFSMISSGSLPLDVYSRAVVERIAELMESLLRAGDREFVVEVPSGSNVAEAVRERLASLGLVFAASSMLEHVRRRTFDATQHGWLLESHPFEKWTAGERHLAPPLLVRLAGHDIDPFELAPLLDGCVCLVLLFGEPSAPALLARLISPGVFVAQAGDLKVLDRLTGFEGPAVIAIMNGAEARFVHDPRVGSAFWQRMRVTHLPDAQPRKSFGNRSAWQQRDDLAHLKGLVEPPVLSPNAAKGAAAAEDASDKIAAWLIGQAGLQAGVS